VRDIIIWVITVEVLGFAAAPPLRAFFANRRDAALLSRPVGLALVAYLGWVLSLSKSIGFGRGTLLLALALLAVAAVFVHRSWRRATVAREPFWGPDETRAALLFWAPAAVFLAIRAAVPEILGAEKFMDLSFLNSLIRHDAMPPLDPWMAGKTINYYYWGYLLAAVLAKLSGVSSFVAYNLSVATFAGYSFVAAACLGLRLSGGKTAAGVWAGIGAVFAGNLTGALDAWHAPFTRDFDYWHASRVIGSGNTINEFPFFTFFHADLHPHLLAFPFFLAAFAAAHRYLEISPALAAPEGWLRRAIAKAWPPFLLVLLCATARAANNWNLPAMALLLVAVGAFRATGGRRLPSFGDGLWGALGGAGLLVVSMVLWIPYSRSYGIEVQGLGRTALKSDFFEFLGVWGLLLAAAYAVLLSADTDGLEPEPSRRRRDFTTAVLGFACLLAAFATKTPVLVLVLPLALLAARVVARSWKARTEDSGLPFAAFLLLLALAMVAGCEFIYFKDSYGAALQRMNTIFKFYHQAWPLAAVAVAVFGERAWRARGAAQPFVQSALAAAMAFSLLYPVEAIVSRFRQSQGGFTLDARTALARRSAGDAAAIAWLETHAPEGSVVLEATGDPYSEFARIASHTGIPTVLGWANHEGLWRSNDPEIVQRADAIRAVYTASDPRTTSLLLKKYRVTYIVLGDLERRTYPAAERIASLSFLENVFPGQTALYRVLSPR
jgi:YYY domain-containing protein